MKCVKTMRRRTEKIIEAWAKGTKGQIISPIPNDNLFLKMIISSLEYCVVPVI